jgi:hypothetical protein
MPAVAAAVTASAAGAFLQELTIGVALTTADILEAAPLVVEIPDHLLLGWVLAIITQVHSPECVLGQGSLEGTQDSQLDELDALLVTRNEHAHVELEVVKVRLLPLFGYG